MADQSRKPIKIRLDDIQLDYALLKDYENPENKKRIGKMARDLKGGKQFEPIIVNEDLTVIWDGHTRYLAAKRLGLQFIDAIIRTTEEQKAYLKAKGA
jgi:hypothetical protein